MKELLGWSFDGALDPWSCLSYRVQILHGSSYGQSKQIPEISEISEISEIPEIPEIPEKKEKNELKVWTPLSLLFSN